MSKQIPEWTATELSTLKQAARELVAAAKDVSSRWHRFGITPGIMESLDSTRKKMEELL